GTPAAAQLECGVNAIFPASTSALSFFIRSTTQGFKFGLLRSAMRNVGCLPVAAASALLTRGWAGSLRTGLGPLGPAMNSTRNVSHPAWLDEKSGGDDRCCAAAPAVSATQARPVKMLPQSNLALEANAHMVLSPLVPFRSRSEFGC